MHSIPQIDEQLLLVSEDLKKMDGNHKDFVKEKVLQIASLLLIQMTVVVC